MKVEFDTIKNELRMQNSSMQQVEEKRILSLKEVQSQRLEELEKQYTIAIAKTKADTKMELQAIKADYKEALEVQEQQFNNQNKKFLGYMEQESVKNHTDKEKQRSILKLEQANQKKAHEIILMKLQER